MGNLFLEGLLLQASLIFALGAQNLFVLESGLRRQYHIVVSFCCFTCDLALIMLGVAGAASLFNQFPILKIFIGILGVLFLFQYGFGKIFSFEGTSGSSDILDEKKSLKRSIILSLTFSILNPHAYLDAFILIGGFSTKYAELTDRLALGFGAACFSLVWFLIISTLASTMKPFLENPRRLRMAMSIAGIALIYMSGKLSLDVYQWITERELNRIVLKTMIDYPYSPSHVFTAIGI